MSYVKTNENITRTEFLKSFFRSFRLDENQPLKITENKYIHYSLPPGAQNVDNYISSCDKCYECIAVCPHMSLIVDHDINEKIAGFPIIIPREKPCYLCEEFLCIIACETKSLHLSDSQSSLGIFSIDKQSCFAFNDNFCFTCITNCPKTGEAITRDHQGRPEINSEKCAGCGICVYVCPTEKPSILIELERKLCRLQE